MKRILILSAFAILSPSLGLQAAKPSSAEKRPHGQFRGVLKADRFDLSPPLRDLPEVPIAPNQARDFDEDREILPVAPPGPQTPDAAVQRAAAGDRVTAMPAPLVTFNGPANSLSVNPPDSDGDVGPNHYVTMKNSHFQIFSKTGTSLLGPSTINTIWSGFGGACQTENAGDPIIVYDNLSDRWVLGQFTAAGPIYYICLAVSQTADPTGSYYRWAIQTGASGLPDYPKLGMMGDAYYISTREFTSASAFYGIGAYALNRAQAVSGNAGATVISMVALASANSAYNLGDGLHPADLDGNILPPAGQPEYYLGHMDNGSTKGATQDAITLWKFTPDWITPANSSFVLANTLTVAAIDTVMPCGTGRQCIAQQSSAQLIDHLGYRQRVTNRVAYRNFGDHESLVTSVSVEAATGISGMRWYEIRSPNAGPVIFQQSTFSGAALSPTDTHSRWMGSIAQDHDGDMAMGYSVSSSTLNPAIRYTGRLAADPLNTMPQGEGVIINGAGAQTTTNNRWGDYTAMNIDPDGCRFWYVNEYYPVSASVGWQLRVGAFRFPGCTDLPGLLRNSTLATLTPSAATKAALFPRAGDPSLAAADNVFSGFDKGGYFPQETVDYSSTNPIIFYQLEGNAGNSLRVSRNAATAKVVVNW